MKGLLSILLLFSLAAHGFSSDLPPVVREALQLELEGRLGEALDQYRAALSSESSLVQDEATAQPLTIKVLSKAAHLAIDLGYGEEAWDLGNRLVGAKNPQAAAAGTLIKVRLLALQNRWPEAQKALDDYSKAWPKAALPPSLLLEAQRVVANSKKPVTLDLAAPSDGPSAWLTDGDWDLLPNPTNALGLKVQDSVRLQVGAFRDWGHVLTLISMLREKGWVPFTEVKTTSAGLKLHAVYIISRQPQTDRFRLQSQGLSVSP